MAWGKYGDGDRRAEEAAEANRAPYSHTQTTYHQRPAAAEAPAAVSQPPATPPAARAPAPRSTAIEHCTRCGIAVETKFSFCPGCSVDLRDARARRTHDVCACGVAFAEGDRFCFGCGAARVCSAVNPSSARAEADASKQEIRFRHEGKDYTIGGKSDLIYVPDENVVLNVGTWVNSKPPEPGNLSVRRANIIMARTVTMQDHRNNEIFRFQHGEQYAVENAAYRLKLDVLLPDGFGTVLRVESWNKIHPPTPAKLSVVEFLGDEVVVASKA